MTVDILIAHAPLSPDLNAACLRCLQSIRENTTDYRVIIIVNGSGDTESIEGELRQHASVVMIRNADNLGFVGAVNQGIAISTAPFIVLLNNDCTAVPGWIAKLQEPFLHRNVGLVGPRTTTQNSWQGRAPAGNGFVILEPHRMLAFFCVMIRREVIEQCGFAHEDFDQFGGFGGDDWLCHLAHHYGWRLALVQDLVIPHGHRSTFETLHSQLTIKRMQSAAINLLREKQLALKTV